ncbi:carbohydrate ABC transporter permease [Bacillus sp. JJ1533]|uniref:carbohydrate ABC transporter permease n=1 Tax=Bacillus sp. JJ1533 TaxID=3122959 RepID=UPI00300011D6
MLRKNIVKRLPHIFYMLLAIIFLIPIIWMIFVSLKTEETQIKTLLDWFVPPYSLQSYINTIKETDVLLWMKNSLIIASIQTALTVVFASMAAFALSHIKFRYKNIIFALIIAGLMVPGEATIISLYEVVKSLNMLNTYEGIILPTIAAPIAVIVLKNFFDGVPKEVIESAEIDGCGTFRVYWQIILPLSKPALAAIAIFIFIGSWNNFLWPYLTLTSPEMYTLPVGIPTLMSTYLVDFVVPMTVNAVASVPVIILFLLFQKQIIQGISFTGGK